MAEIWVLLLGDIDLSTGYVAAIGATITAITLGSPYDFPWWLAMLAAGVADRPPAIGALSSGAIIIKFRLPALHRHAGWLVGLGRCADLSRR